MKTCLLLCCRCVCSVLCCIQCVCWQYACNVVSSTGLGYLVCACLFGQCRPVPADDDDAPGPQGGSGRSTRRSAAAAEPDTGKRTAFLHVVLHNKSSQISVITLLQYVTGVSCVVTHYNDLCIFASSSSTYIGDGFAFGAGFCCDHHSSV